MGVGVAPNTKTWQSFHLTNPSSLCSALNPGAIKISSCFFNTRYRLADRPALSWSSCSRGNSLKRACSADFNEIPDEELRKQIEELAQLFDLPDNDDGNNKETASSVSEISEGNRHREEEDNINMGRFPTLKHEFLEPSLLGIHPEPPDWPERDEIVRINIDQRANRVDIPLSLRIIKRKQQWEEGLKEAGEFTYCSVKKAFSSMVFIIRELQRYALHIRESLYCEDLRGIIDKVQSEMNSSFVWLFQQVFSRTPTLMVYVMILLANFTVYSMTDTIVIDVALSPNVSVATITETEKENQPQIDSRIIRLFPTSTCSIGNGGGGGGEASPIASGTEGGDRNLGKSSLSIQHPNVVPDEVSEVSSFRNKELNTVEEEVKLWESMVEEASRMQAELRGEALDHETVQLFVAPVAVEVESDDYEGYFRTDLLYQMGLSQDPNNTLLLSNYAQFLHLVAHDNDRAEECFKRAVLVEPPDAEAFCGYADFLWIVRKDLWGAEERYQQAMASEPGNPYYASKYASFLWSTGGEETCFPLNASPDNYNKVL